MKLNRKLYMATDNSNVEDIIYSLDNSVDILRSIISTIDMPCNEEVKNYIKEDLILEIRDVISHLELAEDKVNALKNTLG